MKIKHGIITHICIKHMHMYAWSILLILCSCGDIMYFLNVNSKETNSNVIHFKGHDVFLNASFFGNTMVSFENLPDSCYFNKNDFQILSQDGSKLVLDECYQYSGRNRQNLTGDTILEMNNLFCSFDSYSKENIIKILPCGAITYHGHRIINDTITISWKQHNK